MNLLQPLMVRPSRGHRLHRLALPIGQQPAPIHLARRPLILARQPAGHLGGEPRWFRDRTALDELARGNRISRDLPAGTWTRITVLADEAPGLHHALLLREEMSITFTGTFGPADGPPRCA